MTLRALAWVLHGLASALSSATNVPTGSPAFVVTSDPVFGAATEYALGPAQAPMAVAVANVNVLDDDTLDLVTADWGSATTSVLTGTGLGTFTGPGTFTTGWFPTSVAVGDLNGDQNPDVAVNRPDTADVAVLLGDGHGTFGEFEVVVAVDVARPARGESGPGFEVTIGSSLRARPSILGSLPR